MTSSATSTRSSTNSATGGISGLFVFGFVVVGFGLAFVFGLMLDFVLTVVAFAATQNVENRFEMERLNRVVTV